METIILQILVRIELLQSLEIAACDCTFSQEGHQYGIALCLLKVQDIPLVNT